MGTTTPNYSLYKPDPVNDFVNVITDINNNMDTIDTQLKNVSNSVRTILTVRKTAEAQTAVSNTTKFADAHLFLPVEANSVYKLDCFFIYNGAAAPAGGINFDWTGPTGFDVHWAGYSVNNTAALTDYDVVKQLSAGGRAVGTNSSATDMTMQPKGTVVTAGTPGTLTLRWAQAVSNATATILRTHSWIELIKF